MEKNGKGPAKLIVILLLIIAIAAGIFVFIKSRHQEIFYANDDTLKIKAAVDGLRKADSAFPAPAWTEYDGYYVVMGYKGDPPGLDRAMEKSAIMASKVSSAGVLVFAVNEKDRGWRPDAKARPYICSFMAENGTVKYSSFTGN